MKTSDSNFYIEYNIIKSKITKINDNFPFYEDENYLILIEGILISRFLESDNRKINYKDLIKIFSSQKNIDTIAKDFNGNWSLIIFNKLSKEFYVIRDKLGSFPIYYQNTKDKIYLSNNINILKNNHNFDVKVDHITIARYIGLGELNTTKRTFFENIKRIAPNNILKIINNKISIYAYNSYIPKKEKINDKNELFDIFEKSSLKILEEFKDSIISVPLSGGPDSSAIAYIVRSFKKTFFYSLYVEGTDDERDLIKSTVNKFKLNHQFVDWKKFYNLESIDEMIKILGEPFKVPQSLYQYSLKKEAENKKTELLLYGEGADGIFGGSYKKALPFYLIDHLINLRILSFIKYFFRFKPNIFKEDVRFLKRILSLLSFWIFKRKKYPYNITKFARLINDDIKKKLSIDDKQKYELKNKLLQPFKSHLIARLVVEPSAYQVNIDYHLNKSLNIKSRYLYYDKQIAEFGLSSHISQFFKDFQNKSLWRKALKGKISNEISKEKKKLVRPSNNLHFYMNIVLPFWDNLEFKNFIKSYVQEQSISKISKVPINDIDTRFRIRLFLLWRWFKTL